MLIDILIFLLYGVIIWMSWGASVSILKMFVYFHSPRHMLDCYKSNPDMAEWGKKMDADCEGNMFRLFFGIIFASMMLPPLFTLDFLIDVHVFSWRPYKEEQEKQKKNRR